MYNWMKNWFTIENSATFMFTFCLTCQRFWNPSLRPLARPICLLNTYDYARALEKFNAGNPVEYDLPEYVPLKCGVKIDK